MVWATTSARCVRAIQQIIPNGAERIMVMVEQEQVHRINHERSRLEGEIEATRRGHFYGGAITVVAILAAVIGAYLGIHPAVSIAVVSLPIASILKSIFWQISLSDMARQC